MKKLTQALCKCASPSVGQATAKWNKVAFTNYVPVTVGDGAMPRPTTLAWKQAENEWPRLLSALRPHVVIVLGCTMWHRMPATQVIINEDVQGYMLENGEVAMCHATRHPARGPAWDKYTDFITRALQGAV